MDRDWRQGVELLKSGNLPDALRVLRDASRANPESFDSHFYLGIAEAKAGKLSQSRESFQKALSLQRDHAPTYFNLGLAFEKEGRLREAMAHYQQALRYAPGHVPAREAVARLTPRSAVEIAPRPGSTSTPPDEAERVLCKLCGMQTREGDACEWCHQPLEAVQPHLLLSPDSRPGVPPAAASEPPRVPAHASVPSGTSDPTATMGLPVLRGQVMQQYHRSTGFFDSLSRGWLFIQSAYSLAFQKKVLLLPVLYGGIASFIYSAAILAVALLTWHAAGRPTGDALKQWSEMNRALLSILSVAILFGSMSIGYFFMGMTVNMIDAYLKGREPNVRVAWRDAMKNIGAICALAVVGTLVELVLSAIKRRSREAGGLGGMVTAGIASAIETAWTVLSFLLMPVIIIEDTTLRNALARVRDIHRRNLLQIGVGEVGLRIVVSVIGMLFVLALFGLGRLLLPAGVPGIAFFAVIGVTGLAIINLLNAFARASYYTCLYLWAVEVEHAPVASRALVPQPLAAALA